MIVDFSVQNFRSIKELQTLAMNAARIVSRDKDMDARNLIPFSEKLSLLKTKAIYGANASGKSTMIQALTSFVKIVANSVRDEKVLGKEIKCFLLDQKYHLASTYFQLTFIYKRIQYRYGFEATREEITAEWLFGTPGKKEVPFFTRKGVDIQVNEHQFEEGTKVVGLFQQTQNDIARKNSLFLTVVRSFGEGLAAEIIDYLNGYTTISGLADVHLNDIAKEAFGNEQMQRKMVEWLKLADTGIDDITLWESPPDQLKEPKRHYLTTTQHRVMDKAGSFNESAHFIMHIDESEGTKKMFEISPAIIRTLEKSSVLILDEFDARFHPLLSRQIVELFNSASNHGAQFIFATHDTNLFQPNLLRRDQICFVEKDKLGASHFYSLADFKGIRNDASYEKDYIAGRYGAIPFLGDFKSLIED